MSIFGSSHGVHKVSHFQSLSMEVHHRTSTRATEGARTPVLKSVGTCQRLAIILFISTTLSIFRDVKRVTTQS